MSAPSEGAALSLAEAGARMRTACVTGTNGKSTTTTLLAAIVRAAGEPSARMTTLGAWLDDELLTTVSTPEVFEDLAIRAASRGVRTFAIETTSEALAGGFAAAWPPHVAGFTNLTRDHLDAHGTLEEYLAAKAQLFLAARECVVLNASDGASALLREVVTEGVRVRAYAARAVDPDCAGLPLDLQASRVRSTRAGTTIELAPSPLADALGGALTLAMIGDVHAENALAAALMADALGYPASAITRALATFPGVPGRFEVVAQGPMVVVDYAHTPDAVERTLTLARGLAVGGRVLCTFGCGGDRDVGKRAEMGRLAASLADVVVVTTDNPRSEDPAAIADAIEEGAGEGRAEVSRILDREGAIRRIIRQADPSDIVVVLGKGHEKFQIVGEQRLPFDDASTCLAAHAARRKDDEG